MGVWIETILVLSLMLSLLSHPVWVCGLKPVIVYVIKMERDVTPCMGVWIETYLPSVVNGRVNVTPCMGVWIETLSG